MVVASCKMVVVTVRVSHRRREMYIGHACLCVCLSVPCRMPTRLLGNGYNLGEWQRVPLAVHYLGGFAIGTRFSLL